MKKTLRNVLCCLALSPALNAQILNPGFELSRPDGSAVNWEPRLFLPFNPEDTANNCLPDSACYRTDDAYSGKKALILRNISCNGELIYGRVFASDEIPAYSPSAPFTLRPDYISFYYKLIPKAGEGIHVEAILSDNNGMIASADTVLYPGTVAAYTPLKVPVQYWDVTQPERIFLRFSLIDASGGYQDMLPDSKLFLDEIQTGNNITGINTTQLSGSGIQLYPVPAGDWISAMLTGDRIKDAYTLQVSDIAGSVRYKQENVKPGTAVMIDLRDWAAGIYFIKAGNASGQFNAKFVHAR